MYQKLIWVMFFLFVAFNWAGMTASAHACQKQVVVVSGDTLCGLCRTHFGKFDSRLLSMILKYNPGITNPDLIRVGDVICLDAPESPPSVQSKTRSTINSVPATSYNRAMYPPPVNGSITQMTWLDDNTAIVEGRLNAEFPSAVFYVYAPGDLEYEQPGLEKPASDRFRVKAIIGRQGEDYGRSFILKLALLDEDGERFSDVTRPIVRRPHQTNETIVFDQQEIPGSQKTPVGWPGLESWTALQELDALKSDNVAFKIPNGRLIVNYRYLGYNPDEKYLSRYGRITLYGSSCLAKALLLKGDIEKAEQIIRPWAAQVSADGKIPRSANIIGDNYISPDVRTGEVAHFLGALALSKMVSRTSEWDDPIHRIVTAYIIPLIDSKTGLVKGGYNGIGSNGYGRPLAYEKINWCSTEHNLDLFQSLILTARAFRDLGLDITCENLAWSIGKGIDQYLWDEGAGTFYQGWRFEKPDQGRALDCCSWGALYSLKQARLSKESNDNVSADFYLSRARRCLKYADDHFRTEWYYKTPDGREGRIRGYRPYDGKIEDIRYEQGPLAGKVIDWSSQNDVVWSEGTLGVAKAWEELARETGDMNAKKRMQEIYKEMLTLQGLTDNGGMLYSTKQIQGYFSMGEELASISWLGYLAVVNDFKQSRQNGELIKWMSW